METILLLSIVAAITALFMGIFLIFRSLNEKRRSFWNSRFPTEEEEGIVLPEKASALGKPQKQASRMDRAFDQLVNRTGLGWSREQALGWIAFGGVLAASLLVLWRGEMWLFGLGLLLGMGVPLVVYLVLQARWRRKLQNQLPDVLFLLARSLRAGLSLEQGLENVAAYGPKPLAGELKRAVEQVKLGLTVPAALQSVARRLDLTDFDVFVTVVTLHRTLGGNLTMLLDRVASTTRDRNHFRGHFMAATALSRVTSLCLAAGAPLLFVVYAFWQPEFFHTFTQTVSGIRLLVVASVLEVIGIIWVGLLLRSPYK